MILDEIDAAGPAKPRVIGVRTYESLRGAAIIVMIIIAGTFPLAIRRLFGDLGIIISYVNAVMPGLIVIWSRPLVDAGLRRWGLASNGRSIELWAQANSASAEVVSADDVVEVWADRDGEIMASVFCFAIGVPTSVLAASLFINLVATPPADGRWDCVGYLLLSFAVSIGAGLAGVRLVRGEDGGPRYRADATGIVGPEGKPSIPWAAVASCRVTSHLDPTGRLRGRSHELIDRDGNLLHRLRLDSLREGDDGRLIRFVQARFPARLKDVRDGWNS